MSVLLGWQRLAVDDKAGSYGPWHLSVFLDFRHHLEKLGDKIANNGALRRERIGELASVRTYVERRRDIQSFETERKIKSSKNLRFS